MPEPVVIIGPATGPAGPVAGPADHAPDHAPEKPAQPDAPAGPSLALRIIVGSGKLLGRVFLWVMTTLLAVVRRYPRNSFAAGASFLILGAIWFTQVPPGKGNHTPPANAIGIRPSQSPTGDLKTKNDSASTASSTGGSPAAKGERDDKPVPAPAPSSVAAARPTEAVTSEVPGLVAGAASGATSANVEVPSGLPVAAPKPAGAEDSNLPVPAVAAAPTPASAAKPASEQVDVPGDLAAAPAPQSAEPKPFSDATLLVGSVAGALSSEAQAEGGHADSSKAVGVFDKLATTPTSPTEVALAAPPTGDHPAKDGATTDIAATDQSRDSNQSSQPASTPDAQPSPPVEPGKSADPLLANVAPSQPLAASPKPEPIVLPDPSSAIAGATDREREHSHNTTPDPSANAARAVHGSGQGSQEQSRVIPKPVAVDPAPVVLAPPAVAIGTIGATGGGAHSDESSERRTGSAAESSEKRGSQEPSSPSGNTENSSAAPRSETLAQPTMKIDTDGTRWIPIANSGKIPGDSTEDSDLGSAQEQSGPNQRPARDPRAHTAKEMNFEAASPQPEPRMPDPGESSRLEAGPTSGSRPVSPTGTGRSSDRVECVPHVVERNENFWTISRLYYNSGRYYKALWKSNEVKYPDINILHVGDVIMIPAIEDLDPAEILPARSPAPGASVARTSQAPVPSDGTLSRRVHPADPDLDLPAPSSSPRGRLAVRGASHVSERESADDARDDSEPEIRTVARPQSTGDVRRAPVYKVRRYDTLRSIARDTLGDSRRANEILELNRDLIADPAQLIVGQVLELPEDARTSIRRSASR